MMRSINEFLHRVRIHGGEFDASARAMHRQAALEIVSSATIERKKMSTKTTLKRIALVAVAALAFGGLSAVSASASAGIIADSFTAAGAATASTAGTAGTASTLATIYSGIAAANTDTATVAGSVISSPITSSATAITYADTAGATQVNSAFATPTITAAAAGRTTRYVTASFTPDVAGTYVLKLTSANAVNNAYILWTITVAATPAVAAANSTSITNAGILVAGVTDTVVAAPKAAVVSAGGQAATIVVTSKNSSGTDLTSSTALTAVITGPGNLGFGGGGGPAVGAVVPQGRALTGTAGYNYIGVFADGVAGTSTITISAGTTVLATETVTFYGPLASLSASMTNSIQGDTTAAQTGVQVVAKDANGVVIPNVAVTVTSGNTAVVSAAAGTTATAAEVTAGLGADATFTATSVAGKYGVVTLTIADTATGLITTTVALTVSSATVASVTLAFDATSYAPGQKMTLTVSAKDAAGLPVVDGTTVASLFSTAPTANVALAGIATPTFGTSTLKGGSASAVFYAPLLAGDVVFTGNDSTTAKNAVTATGTVAGGDAAAAVDAANAATDAANYAADAADAATTAAQEATAAAQAAQDSADAATAAVVALGLRVDTLMASVRAQLTSLSNLLVRIIKKTKA